MIKVFDKSSAANQDFTITVYQGGKKIPNLIIDTDHINLTISDLTHHSIIGYLSVTSRIDGSFSNILDVYSVSIEIETKKVKFYL